MLGLKLIHISIKGPWEHIIINNDDKMGVYTTGYHLYIYIYVYTYVCNILNTTKFKVFLISASWWKRFHSIVSFERLIYF